MALFLIKLEDIFGTDQKYLVNAASEKEALTIVELDETQLKEMNEPFASDITRFSVEVEEVNIPEGVGKLL